MNLLQQSVIKLILAFTVGCPQIINKLNFEPSQQCVQWTLSMYWYFNLHSRGSTNWIWTCSTFNGHKQTRNPTRNQPTSFGLNSSDYWKNEACQEKWLITVYKFVRPLHWRAYSLSFSFPFDYFLTIFILFIFYFFSPSFTLVFHPSLPPRLPSCVLSFP